MLSALLVLRFIQVLVTTLTQGHDISVCECTKQKKPCPGCTFRTDSVWMFSSNKSEPTRNWLAVPQFQQEIHLEQIANMSRKTRLIWLLQTKELLRDIPEGQFNEAGNRTAKEHRKEGYLQEFEAQPADGLHHELTLKGMVQYLLSPLLLRNKELVTYKLLTTLDLIDLQITSRNRDPLPPCVFRDVVQRHGNAR